jgi:hypothetical protein
VENGVTMGRALPAGVRQNDREGSTTLSPCLGRNRNNPVPVTQDHIIRSIRQKSPLGRGRDSFGGHMPRDQHFTGHPRIKGESQS